MANNTEEDYKLRELSDAMYRAKRHIANADDIDEAIQKFYDARNEYQSFEQSIKDKQDEKKRDNNIEYLIEDEKVTQETYGDRYQYKDIFKKAPSLAALQNSKDMYELTKTDEYKKILKQEGKSDEEVEEEILKMQLSYQKDIKDLEYYIGLKSKSKKLAKGGKLEKEGGKTAKQASLAKTLRTFADGGVIASNIIMQLGGFSRLQIMLGAYNFVDLKNGLSFKIKNPKANYIKITLNGKDLYDIEIGRIRGTTYKVVHSQEDVYAVDLRKVIEKHTGMYMAFEDGGDVVLEDAYYREGYTDEETLILSSTDKLANGGITAMEVLEAREFVGEKDWVKMKPKERLAATRYLIRTGKIGYYAYAHGGTTKARPTHKISYVKKYKVKYLIGYSDEEEGLKYYEEFYYADSKDVAALEVFDHLQRQGYTHIEILSITLMADKGMEVQSDEQLMQKYRKLKGNYVPDWFRDMPTRYKVEIIEEIEEGYEDEKPEGDEFAMGGSIESKRQKVVDYYINNEDDEVLNFEYGVNERALENRDKYYKEIFEKISSQLEDEEIYYKFRELNIDEESEEPEDYAKGGKISLEDKNIKPALNFDKTYHTNSGEVYEFPFGYSMDEVADLWEKSYKSKKDEIKFNELIDNFDSSWFPYKGVEKLSDEKKKTILFGMASGFNPDDIIWYSIKGNMGDSRLSQKLKDEIEKFSPEIADSINWIISPNTWEKIKPQLVKYKKQNGLDTDNYYVDRYKQLMQRAMFKKQKEYMKADILNIDLERFEKIKKLAENKFAKGGMFKNIVKIGGGPEELLRYVNTTIKDRSERDSVRIAKEYQKVIDSKFDERAYNNYKELVKETEIPKDDLQKIETYVMTTPRENRRDIDIYRYWSLKDLSKGWEGKSMPTDDRREMIKRFPKMAKGGKVKNPAPDYPDFVSMQYKMGGDIEWGEDLGNGFSVGNDVYITDSKSMHKGKTGFVSGLAGKDLLVTISENGNERSIVVSKKGVEMLDAPMAKGGEVIDLKDVYYDLQKEVGHMSINEETKDYINSDIRDWGNWEHDYEDYERDEEDFEDDDDMILSHDSGKMMQNIINEIRIKYPSVLIKWDTSEKNHVDFYISRKMAKGGKMAKGKVKDSFIEGDKIMGNMMNRWNSEMAKKPAKFKDKVKAISKSLEGKKVPKRVRKDYGATYDKKESMDAAKRIAGSMAKKERKRYEI